MGDKIADLFGHRRTCPIDGLEDGCVSFVRSPKYLKHLEWCGKDVYVFVSKETWEQMCGGGPGVKPIFVEDPYYSFILYHNVVNKNRDRGEIKIGTNCDVHSTVVLGIEGLRAGMSPEGRWLQCKHMGGIVIENDVEIGAYSVVNRGVFGDTVIRSGVKIGAMVRIGDEAEIGENTILTSRVDVNGGTKIGKGCHVQTGTVVGSGVQICDKVVLGIGSVVVKSITESGIYVGNPAKFLKPFLEFRRYDGNIHL